MTDLITTDLIMKVLAQNRRIESVINLGAKVHDLCQW